MKKYFSSRLVIAVMPFCVALTPFNKVLAQAKTEDAKMNAYVKGLMSKMTLDEKIGQLNLVTIGAATTGSVVNKGVEENIKNGSIGGVFGVWGTTQTRQIQDIAVKNSRLHIPLIFGLDVIHGHRTIFPIPLGMSATWDMGLIKQSAQIAAKEATGEGLNWVFSPMVDIARDPRWGRISEGSGEDPWYGSQVAKAMVQGYQGTSMKDADAVMACVKHFALYGGAEAGREYNTVDMSRIKMYQDYLPPYKAAVDAGAGSFMSSFNTVDGVPATVNQWLLTDLLRKQWGFKGFVVSDYTAVNEVTDHGLGDLQTVSALALKAGLDMDMVGEGFLKTLKNSLTQKKITQQEIDLACRRVLEAKYKLGLFDNPYKSMDADKEAKEELSTANRAAAREITKHSFVLLKNDNQTLPLKKGGSIALVGPLADNHRDMLGTWVIAGEWQKSVSVMEGIKNVVGNNVAINYAMGANITEDSLFIKRLNFGPGMVSLDAKPANELLKEAVDAAKKSDVIVAVVGESQSMSGESSSRSDIDIPESQKNMLKELSKLGKPMVIVLFNGRPLTLTWEDKHANAILDVWAPGTEAGNAIADVLFGDYNPAGKLTATFPRSVGQIPIYYNHKNTGRPYKGGPSKFRSNYLDISNDPLYPFGYGLSYTTFNYSAVSVNKTKLKGNETLTANVTVTNTGKYAGEEVVQLYISDPVASISRSVKELKGYQKISLQPGASKQVSFTITPEQLKFYNTQLKYDWEPGEFVVEIGTNSADTHNASVWWAK
ncbi:MULTISPECIES: beta-glucosidase BglX [Mucilaginibacter]|uniref:beta-glucosidase n=2 Tax=Mucilaginibacter rubeus TaxID=2027860 RepID=A0ABX7UKK1_9SPHI|nr:MULTISPECIES: beta-glucosidase BglX [Mucilaginibacter]QTE45711.1 beta-glucosidase BglX [Mucilaginibacter rubeus]QTE52308.1 beta-glucosidase BglX [Mucilaginibacter rubeus]QTE57397.1 beta-glucosidase BglX [Mucilaginibacter rubeus]QTE63141.1 beta-glucosidase BglX [Mucilaginibacter rubeus]QTF61900.1 beta-glucosidase BglX [Mucilaginibacter rubeus]